MRPALAYRPGAGALSRASAAGATAYLGSMALVAFVFSSPIVLVGAGAAAAVAGLAAGAREALALAARWAVLLAILIIAVNAIASQRGDTILVRGWELPLLGPIDVSAEALVEGAVVALRIAVVFAAFAVYSACVDPDRVLRLLRPVARHSALTATLITRLVPLATADLARLRDARALRGPAAAEVGRAALVRRLVAGSLDRAVDVAATLELRGYGRGLPRRAGRERRSRGSWRFAAAAVAIAAGGIAGDIAGAGSFEAYPGVSIETGALTIALAVALPLLAAAPFAGAGTLRRRTPR